jgi:thiol:disulfide interchange protein DsbD
MYRDKFKFVLEGGTWVRRNCRRARSRTTRIFGRVETYRKDVKILFPVEAAGTVTLKAVSQGCWDGGICYPPINQEAVLDLAATGGSAAPGVAPGAVPLQRRLSLNKASRRPGRRKLAHRRPVQG